MGHLNWNSNPCATGRTYILYRFIVYWAHTPLLFFKACCAAGDFRVSEIFKVSWISPLSVTTLEGCFDYRVLSPSSASPEAAFTALCGSKRSGFIEKWQTTKTKTFLLTNEKNRNSLMASDSFIQVEGKQFSSFCRF